MKTGKTAKMKKIIIYSEVSDGKFDNVTYELASKAYSLKQKALEFKEVDYVFDITIVAITPSLQAESIASAYCSGADNIVLLKNEDIKPYELSKYADIFLKYYLENPSDIILFPATPFGRMLAPRITTLLDTGLVADCTDLDFILNKNNEIKLAPTRPTFGEELMATIVSKSSPECATIRPGTFQADFSKNVSGTCIEHNIKSEKISAIKLLRSYQETKTDKPDFSRSNIILAAGMGLTSKDNSYFEKLKNLAKKLNVGYAVTRKVVDSGIESSDYQIGQTGSSANPDLYVAFGISGAIQHIQGMKNSKTVIAINTNKNAPIFKYSDYKIVADAKEVLDDILKYI